MKDTINIPVSDRIKVLKERTMSEERFLSLEQAKIITRIYRENEELPVCLKRAESLAHSLREITIAIDSNELIVGNRTPGIRSGVVFPEAGISWLSDEIEILPVRPQDKFNLKPGDVGYFRDHIEPYWRGNTLEDTIFFRIGEEIRAISRVVKINQKDHAQGHICPDVETWLKYGPAGLLEMTSQRLEKAETSQVDFFKSVIITLKASCDFILRYSVLASEMSFMESDPEIIKNLREVSSVCEKLHRSPPSDFREAVQSVWFLFVILHMESNASSFSPGRIDQYLYPYFIRDINSGRLTYPSALELIDSLFIKFNQIVYLRNSDSAKYFAGFPIGFNLAIGGQKGSGEDATNELTFLFLKAQDHIRLPQPNLTARVHRDSSQEYLNECTRIIALGTGMPQIVNDESIIPALISSGIDSPDALDYAVVGCVELATQGNFLGWSDAAMFNMVKVLELTLNNGVCMLSGEQTGPDKGNLNSYRTFKELEMAFASQIDHFLERMINACEVVEKIHQQKMPSPFLSSVIRDCLDKGVDVTAGGAKYNFSGIQAIQVANIADSLAALRQLVYETRVISKQEMLDALRNNFSGCEILRQICINKAPKYGNDIASVDELGSKWIRYFAKKLEQYKNYRGGSYSMGLYTVSAHVPMGQNVGATPDGRFAGTPLADGGVSPMYGRDKSGPTAVLKSVARLPFSMAVNGTLLNMKFLPSFFRKTEDRIKFSSMIRAFIELKIHHVQFNVVSKEDLLKAKSNPDLYRGLTVRVAGYTAYFTELAEDLQDEIIQRTSFGGND
jgi:pyruvate formate-lyase/glycerol dehydratase family glycyl radical enzyme